MGIIHDVDGNTDKLDIIFIKRLHSAYLTDNRSFYAHLPCCTLYLHKVHTYVRRTCRLSVDAQTILILFPQHPHIALFDTNYSHINSTHDASLDTMLNGRILPTVSPAFLKQECSMAAT